MKCSFIKEQRPVFQLLTMYRRALKVRRSGYYAWFKEPQLHRALKSAKFPD